MSSPKKFEFLKFMEPHLGIQICEFLLGIDKDNAELAKIYQGFLKSCGRFDTLLEKGMISKEEFEAKKDIFTKKEEELKEKLHGFLNLCANCKKINNYDINSFPLGKKIVSIKYFYNIYKYRMTRLIPIKL